MRTTHPSTRRRVPSMKKPGEFRARCTMRRRVWERRMTAEEIADAKAKGYTRVFNRLESERRDPEKGQHGRWEWALPACEGFETTDKAAFEQHMRDEHGRGPAYVRSETESFGNSIRAGWRAPRLSATGQDLTKAAAEQLQTCPTCELKAQVDTLASEQWWREHLRGCALAQSGVAS